jgi:E3 ubiquitin-protein ligase RNF5
MELPSRSHNPLHLASSPDSPFVAPTSATTSSSSTAFAHSAAATAVGHTSFIDEQDARFSCNICLDAVKDPVVTPCGHLYCWPCLFRWLKTHHTTCPVCKSGVTQDNIIPIYIRGCDQDPRLKETGGLQEIQAGQDVPSRPQGRRIDAATQNIANTNGPQAHGFGGITISTSYGFFPSLFGLQFQSFTPSSTPPPRNNNNNNNNSNRVLGEDEAQQLYLSRALYLLTSLVIFCLLFF